MNARDLRFLIVEDHEFQRAMLVKILEKLGAKAVYPAADGQAALALLDAHGIDVIITDVEMPAMDGLEFIRHIGRGAYDASLIIASGLERDLLASVENMTVAYGIPFLGTIEKPVTLRKVRELIDLHAGGPLAARPAAPQTYSSEEIVDALGNDEFEPYFQPQVEISTRSVVGCEALARWNHGRDGIVGPYAFVHTFEESDHIDTLTSCMLMKAAQFCRSLHDCGHDATVAINLSVKSLDDVRAAARITESVRQQSVDPRWLVLEITETTAATNIGAVLENLARLRMKGFQLSIDDYGTGYSSLQQLSRVPFSELKIDQAFVKHAGTKESARVILESSLDMARRLNIRAIAEGVETTANWDLLADLKCDVAQGYCIARPLPAVDYIAWLKTWEEKVRTRKRRKIGA